MDLRLDTVVNKGLVFYSNVCDKKTGNLVYTGRKILHQISSNDGK